ncbi:hypothetical protein REPUB_Repub02eG0069600 [Reevesia pubescens]
MWILFFEEEKKNSDGDAIECKLHGLIHDLAKSVAGEDIFIFERDCLPKNVARVRYSSVVCHSESCTIPEALYEAKKLRTLIFLFSNGDSGEVPTKLFSHFRNLRVLGLGYSGIKRLQSTVSCLKYLRNLENVKQEPVAVLLRMKNLHSLELSWANNHNGLDLKVRNYSNCKQGEKVLNCLQPPQNLKRLSIKGYPGIHLPKWMSTIALPILTKIVLINCKGFEHLPALGKLPVLEIIHIHGMDVVKNISSEFYGEDTKKSFASLKELSLIDFPNLEFWWSMSGGEEFPSLALTRQIIHQ